MQMQERYFGFVISVRSFVKWKMKLTCRVVSGLSEAEQQGAKKYQLVQIRFLPSIFGYTIWTNLAHRVYSMQVTTIIALNLMYELQIFDVLDKAHSILFQDIKHINRYK